MKTVIKKHLNLEVVERAIIENKYDDKSTHLFINTLEEELIKELHRGFTTESESTIINRVVGFMAEVEVLLKQGFDVGWAAEYVNRSHRPEKAHAVSFAFLACEGSLSNSEDNLKLYARLTKRDSHFVEYFSMLMADPEDQILFEIPAEEYADKYSQLIKKLIAEGKSKHYAMIYAFYAANESMPPYRCHIAGMEADLAKKNRYGIHDLHDYADILSGYIYDHFETYEDALNDERTMRMRKKYIDENN